MSVAAAGELLERIWVLDFLSIFRRRKPGKARKRKPSGSWRVELDKIGGLVGNGKPKRPALTPSPAHQPVPEALQIEPLRDEFLVADQGHRTPQWLHPLHPETVSADLFRKESPQRPGGPGRTAAPPAIARAEAPPRDAEPRFVPPRPRRADPQFQQSQAAQGYLAAHRVEKSFGPRKVVRGASLFVRRGEAVGLLGPNGAGKTTIFYMITGLIKADAGKIELDGNDVTPLPMYQRARLGIGYLPQEASIFRGLNVEENIRSVLEVVEPDAKRRERDLDALLDEFNITRLRKSPSIALSGGERRRVEIARALASRPSYMLLDEPFAGIDPIAVGDIQQLVKHLTYRGIGVLITDHNVRETLGLTDRAYIIYSGEVLMEGRAEDIVNNPDVRRLYLGEEFRL
jgi:lipopolysaccharide export system ATP-binding protein